MELSRRILNLASSTTVALNAKASALAREGHRVINFGVGEPDFSTPPVIVEKCMQALRDGKTKYGAAGGGPELLEAISRKLLRDNGLKYNSDEIVAGIGAKEILFHIFLSLLNDGDEVLIPSPYWVSYPEQIKAAGAKPVFLPMNDDLSRPVSIETIDRLVTKRTVGIVLNSPNNPAGYVFRKNELADLGGYLAAKDWWVVSDDVYEYLTFEGEHLSLLQVCPDLADRFFLANGLSKSFAMTGWRVGYGAGPKRVMKMVRGLQSHSTTCIPGFIEAAAVFAVSQGRELMRREIEMFRTRRDLAVTELKKIPGLKFMPPHGAFYVFIDIRDRLHESKKFSGGDSMAFSDYLLTRHHVSMVPGEAFGTPGFIRLSYATDEASITEGLARLGMALAEI